MPACRNCGYYVKSMDGYCPGCGQSLKVQRPPKQRTQRKTSALGAIGAVLKVLIVIGVVLLMILPQAQPHREKLFTYLEDGLRHYQEYPDRTSYILERTMELESMSMDLDYTLTVEFPETLEVSGHQYQERFEEPTYSFGGTSADPSRSDEDSSYTDLEGQHVDDKFIKYSGKVNGGNNIEVTVTYYINSFTVSWDINDRKSGGVSDIPSWIKEQYNHDQWPLLDSNGRQMVDVVGGVEIKAFHIWPSHPVLKSKAEELTDGKYTVFSKVKALYDFLDHEFDYVTGGGAPKACITTFNDKTGDCDDQSILLITMCRAIGIPAWLEGGAMYDANAAQATGDPTQGWGGHAWARVLIPVKDEDGGFNQEETAIDIVNDQFLIRDANKFTDWIDRWGDDAHIIEYYKSWRYTYSTNQAFQAPTVGDEYYLQDYKAEQKQLNIRV